MAPGWRWSGRSLSNPLDHPVLLAQRAAVVLLDPQRHAAVVEGVVALSPDHFREIKAAEGRRERDNQLTTRPTITPICLWLYAQHIVRVLMFVTADVHFCSGSGVLRIGLRLDRLYTFDQDIQD